LTGNHQILKNQKLTHLKDFQQRMEHIRNLLAKDKIDVMDYQKFKTEYEGLINKLDKELKVLKKRVPDIDDLLSLNTKELLQLEDVIRDGNSENIRSMVHLMYPQKLMFHGHILEAEKINEALNYIYHY